MRRIFTLSFALVCLTVISSKSFGQCSSTTATPSVTYNSQVYQPLNISGNNGTGTETSERLYSTSSLSTINYFYILSASSNNTSVTATTTIKYQAANGTIQQFATCTSTLTVGNSAANYYFTLSGTALPANTLFQITTTFTNTASSAQNTVTVSGFRVQNNVGSTGSNIVLPVHFSKVAVSKAAEGALVTWNVGTEQNVSGYDVEKSTDGRSFTKIGFVAASGLSSYSFADTKAGVVNFYRVKSVDVDGKYSFSTVVALNNGAASVVVKAFMSDKNTLTVQHDAAQAGSRISVVSMDGRVVKQQLPTAGAQQTTVDLSNAQTGLYIIRYDNGQGGSQSIKVAK